MQEQCTGTVLGGFWCREAVAARLPTRHRHYQRVGSRASTRKHSNRGDLDRLLPLFFFSPAVRITVTCKRKKSTSQSILISSPIYSQVLHFLDLFLFMLCLCFLEAAVYASGSGGENGRRWLASVRPPLGEELRRVEGGSVEAGGST